MPALGGTISTPECLIDGEKMPVSCLPRPSSPWNTSVEAEIFSNRSANIPCSAATYQRGTRFWVCNGERSKVPVFVEFAV